MRLIRQSVLYFKEGNSDKVYEIDLCNVGADKYVVNFRYGRRGAVLKEGTKTAVPVSLNEAEKIYDALETEKITKGYTTSVSGVSDIPKAPAFQLETKPFSPDISWASLPAGKTKAILQRLHNAATGNNATVKTPWKISRVIWKAGEYKIEAATPYLVELFNKGNALHQYSCAWALARSGDSIAVTVLQSLFSNHPAGAIKKIAGAGLIKQQNNLAKETAVQHYINSLPEAFKLAVNSNDTKIFRQLLQDRVSQQQPNYNWLEDIYLISVDKRWLRPALKETLQNLPLRPGFFRHIRSIYKLSELLDDYEVNGLLSHRFEREEEMFSHQLTGELKAEGEKAFIASLGEFVNLSTEFKKSTSRLAYSQRTRWYLHHRTSRRLAMMGYNNNTDYVKLATALLTSYDYEKDFSKEYSTYNYKYINNRYQQVETKFPQNAKSVYLHYILKGNHPELELVSGNKLWRLRTATAKTSAGSRSQQQESGSGLFKKIIGLFGKKKEPEALQPIEEQPAAAGNESGTPFLHLWNQMPQAYVQLLMEAQMVEIHQFAERELTKHPQYGDIKNKLDKEACKKLLLSPFDIPAGFGCNLTKEKYSGTVADDDLVVALLDSINSNAGNLGKLWAESNSSFYIQQSGFIAGIITARKEEIRNWGKSFLQNKTIETTVRSAAVGKVVAAVTAYTKQDAENEAMIKSASDTLFELFGAEVKEISFAVVNDLLQHPNPSVLLFGLRLLKAKEQQINPNELTDNFISSLLHHSYAPVRETGLGFLKAMSDDSLLKRKELIINNCISPYENVRTGIARVVDRMAKTDKAFGNKAAETLMPYLLRKEPFEGLHKDVSNLLCNELSNHLQNANKETALNLLYSNYSAAQNVGVIILEKYTEPAQLTILQVIALGGHENLNVREWCWKFYKEQTPRIRYEKEAAIKLLESKWQDTRLFAMQYFRENFSESDWTPEVLISLADSVKPDVEAYGRELITKYFVSERGAEYLLKLSQHPSEKMQLFATNYLELYAANDVGKLQSLDFYFRSVLTRVNKSRVAKNRIYHFLLTEGKKSEAAAKAVSKILTDVSATAVIGDKAKCIEVLLQLNALYEVSTPLLISEPETRA